MTKTNTFNPPASHEWFGLVPTKKFELDRLNETLKSFRSLKVAK